jgi:hypothetical protein
LKKRLRAIERPFVDIQGLSAGLVDRVGAAERGAGRTAESKPRIRRIGVSLSWTPLSATVVSVVFWLLAPSMLAAEADRPHSVTWADIKVSISGTICFPIQDGKPSSFPIVGDRATCQGKTHSHSIDEAVDATIADSGFLLAPIPGYEPKWARTLKEIPLTTDQEQRDALARDAFLGDTTFVTPIRTGVVTRLASQGITCADCPKREVHRRSVSWKSVVPYLNAFVSVDSIVTVAADGTPLAEPQYSFHVCSGINTVTELPRDEGLARAGFLAAHDVREYVVDQFSEVLGDAEYRAQKTDAARTKFASEHLHRRLQDSSELKAGICGVLARYGADVELVPTDCTP